MRKTAALCLFCSSLFFGLPAAAEESEEDVSRRYHEAGVADAKEMSRKFEE